MAYRSSRSEISERDYSHRRAPPTREYDELDVDVQIRERDRADRTPAFLREERRSDAGPLVLRTREVETLDRRRPRSPSPQPIRYRERYVEREPSPLPERRPRYIERERSPSPQTKVRVEERFIERRRERERSPTPEDREREQINVRIERERKKERIPSPSPSPSPSPPPQFIRGPTIEREVITHYRDIDHGMIRAKPPSPPPPAPRPRERESRETDIDIDIHRGETDIDIRRRTRSRSRPRERPRPKHRPSSFDEDDLVIVKGKDTLKVSDTHRRRAHSAAPKPEWDDEAEYITSKIDSRGRMGEAWHGATKDWTIVDVPPGTERVKMDGVGGGGAEVTWQRYNGVRRSKFIPERERERDESVSVVSAPSREEPERDSRERLSVAIYDSKARDKSRDREVEVEEIHDRRISIRDGERMPTRKREGMWTEITKDLVLREAIERMGYEYEETEWFFYVMQYLRYEDVLELVNLSDDIRRHRKQRAREIEERDYYDKYESRHRSRRSGHWDKIDDERIVEREVVYDRPPRYYR
ncbi:hypothetical protein F5Y16DRAFT_368558 [Xylariaceae sp. FL0255]|nr:hypothetical protein F5Y16DRAFT_368558 [Xylariaceae sp. FL0255]